MILCSSSRNLLSCEKSPDGLLGVAGASFSLRTAVNPPQKPSVCHISDCSFGAVQECRRLLWCQNSAERVGVCYGVNVLAVQGVEERRKRGVDLVLGYRHGCEQGLYRSGKGHRGRCRDFSHSCTSPSDFPKGRRHPASGVRTSGSLPDSCQTNNGLAVTLVLYGFKGGCLERSSSFVTKTFRVSVSIIAPLYRRFIR